MDFILWGLLVAILLLVFSPSLRARIFVYFLAWLQRRLLRQMQSRQEQGRRSTNAQSYDRTEANRGRKNTQAASSQRGKLDIQDIAAKKFTKAQSDDYVDFEELPK